LHRLDTTEPSAAVMDAIPVTRIYLAGSATGVAKGDVLLFVGKKSTDTVPLILRAADVAEEFDRQPTGEQVTRTRVDLEALPTTAAPEPRLSGTRRFHYLSPAFPPFAAVRLATLPFTTATLVATVASQAWREADLHALIGIQ